VNRASPHPDRPGTPKRERSRPPDIMRQNSG
jgi:hypothetical protein